MESTAPTTSDLPLKFSLVLEHKDRHDDVIYQRSMLFRIRCKVEKSYLFSHIDSGSQENLDSTAMVEQLRLPRNH